MIEKLKRTEAIILAIVCGCIIAAGLNTMIVSNNIARIEAHVDSKIQVNKLPAFDTIGMSTTNRWHR